MRSYKAAISHSILMVRKNIESYLLLSVTILLSFTFLLAYFVYSDSEIYNKYKEVFSVPGTIGIAGGTLKNLETMDTEQVMMEKQNYLISKLDKMKDTSYMRVFTYSDNLKHYSNEESSITATAHIVPNNFKELYIHGESSLDHIKPIVGEGILENSNDIILDETFYTLLTGGNREGKLTVSLPYISNTGEREFKEYRVVGVVNDGKSKRLSSSEDINVYYVDYYISQENLDLFDMKALSKEILINSENIIQVGEICKNLNMAFDSSYRFQQKAKEEMRNRVFIKGSIMIVLFVLLAINLYSSFNNALKDRRYEIGVKRALGANKKDIILQFFFEGIIVMVINTCMAIFITTILALIYKFIERLVYKNTWTIYISRYSVIMFAVLTVFLTIVFSFIFAYESTGVEIVKHLKGE